MTARALALALALICAAPRSALAHAHLKRSTPAAGAHVARPPAQLRLDFTEAPELAVTAVHLRDADGREIALGALAYASDRRTIVASITGAMEAGSYVVAWQTVGDDGHPVRGEFSFVVDTGNVVARATPAPVTRVSTPPTTREMPMLDVTSPAYVVVRWLDFVSLLLLIGAASFRQLVVTRVTAMEWDVALREDVEARAAWIGTAAALVLLVTLVLRLGAQTYAMYGVHEGSSIASIGRMLRGTMWGWGWFLQLAGALVAYASFATERWRAAQLAAIACAVASALASHAASVSQLRGVAIASDAMHLLGASTWLGSLVVLLAAGMSTIAQEAAAPRGPLVRALVNAFSPVALASAGIVVATGVIAAWLHVGAWQNLWSTRYGTVLLVKLALVAATALVGFYNWRKVRPALGTDDASRWLVRSARVEVTLAALILVVTAVLVATPTSID